LRTPAERRVPEGPCERAEARVRYGRDGDRGRRRAAGRHPRPRARPAGEERLPGQRLTRAPPQYPCLTAIHTAATIAAPIARFSTSVVTKYGYTISARPPASCGHRSCFLPYTNRTNPIPLVTSERNSSPGSSDMIHYCHSILPS